MSLDLPPKPQVETCSPQNDPHMIACRPSDMFVFVLGLREESSTSNATVQENMKLQRSQTAQCACDGCSGFRAKCSKSTN